MHAIYTLCAEQCVYIFIYFSKKENKEKLVSVEKEEKNNFPQ
jgi:hypothetical protein